MGPMTAADTPHTTAGLSPSAHQVITAIATMSVVLGTGGALCTSAVVT
jgi:hypothetical protein